MLYANSYDGEKILAAPNARALCPACNGRVKPKCGEINVWHWAHENRAECDLWSESETEWHLDWKRHFPAQYVEVLIERNGSKHRADIYIHGTVIEFQHSPISPDEIRSRELFYGNMVWVFDVRSPVENDNLYFSGRGNYFTFGWKHPRKHVAYTNRCSYWDIGDYQMFKVKKIYTDSFCRGWGYILDTLDFIERFLGKAPNTESRAGASRLIAPETFEQ